MAEWFPWYPVRFKAKTMHLSLAEDGLYRRLIDHYMETKQSLPDNHAALARIVGISLEEFNKIAAAIMRPFFCYDEPGKIHHKTCDEILAEQAARSQKQALKGKKGAEIKWKKNIENKEKNSSGHSTGINHVMPGDGLIQDKTRQEIEVESDKGSLSVPTPSISLKERDNKFVIPEWMQNGCLEAWKAWLEIRKKKGWPNTDFALRMAVKELEKLKNEGNDPQAIIESAVLKAYRSFYPLKPDYQPSMNFSSHRPPEAKKSNVRIL